MAEAHLLGLDPLLLDLLRCPLPHHAPLRIDPHAGTLVCTECGAAFPVIDGLPVMLVEEADPGPGL